jgi:hypothetical protein
MKVRWGPLLVSAGFAAIGLVITVVDREERALGIMCLLFFGGCTLVLGAPLLSRSDGRVRIVSDGAEPGFLFALGAAKQIVLVISCAVIAVAGVLIALTVSPLIGIACTVVMGGFGIVALVRLGKGGHGLVLTPTRVIVTVNGRKELAWDEIAEVALYGDASARVLGITAVDPARLASGTWAQINRAFDPADVMLPAEQLVGDPEHALRLMTTYLEHPERRAAIGTEAELARVR